MKSLKDRLEAYMKSHHSEWIPKGILCDIARSSDLAATGEHTGRRLRELVESGMLQVKLVKGHAHYRALSPTHFKESHDSMVALWKSYE